MPVQVLLRRVVLTLVVAGAILLVAAAGVFASATASATLDELAGWRFSAITETDCYTINPLLDDSRLFWTRSTEGSGSELVMLDDLSGEQTVIVADGLSPRNFDVSGDHLVFTGYDGIDPEIFLLTLSTGAVTKLTDNNWEDNQPRICGDLVTWERATYATASMVSSLLVYDLATEQTAELYSQENQIGLQSALMDGAWIVWRVFRHESPGGWTTWAFSRSSGQITELAEVDSLQVHALVDGVLYYTRDSEDRSDLLALDLATGTTMPVASNDKQIQSVRICGDLVAWATWQWEDGLTSSYLHVLDRSTGGRSAVIPSLGYTVGSLDLSNDVLVWRGDSHSRTMSVPSSYVFAYDIARGTVTRLTSTQGHVQGGSADGRLVMFEQHRLLSDNPSYETDIVVVTPAETIGPVFLDVSGSHPYRTSIAGLAGWGVVAGYPAAGGGADFRPEASLTRSQFCKMLAEALDLTVSEDLTAPFSDLGADDLSSLYPHDYVAVLAARGIIKGSGAGRFSPYAELSRAQLVTLIARAASELLPGTIPDYPYDEEWSWTTLGKFDATHALPMRWAEWSGLLDGLVGFAPSWDPWAPASRGEAAQLLWNLASMK